MSKCNNFFGKKKNIKVTIENFGGSVYTALKADENIHSNSCIIDKKIFNPFSGSKENDINTNSLNDDIATKFYILSVSVIGLYIFYKVLLK